jgi:hypothetical protein
MVAYVARILALIIIHCAHRKQLFVLYGSQKKQLLLYVEINGWSLQQMLYIHCAVQTANIVLYCIVLYTHKKICGREALRFTHTLQASTTEFYVFCFCKFLGG